MQKTLATSADAEIILKLYQLRTEPLMREARAWVGGEFWPASADEFFSLLGNHDAKGSAFLRQVVSYWEMAAALVLHGALSADLYIDCNNEPFFILAKLEPIMPDIHAKSPKYFSKTLQLIDSFPPAAARYEIAKKNVEGLRARRAAK
jgi:hypothetical protein